MTAPTEAQWNRLLDAVSVDRELQGEFMGPGAAGRMTAKWEQLAAALNAMGGAFKTGEKWKEAFQNLRNRAKRQYADRSRYTRGTGGGPPPAASLGLSPVYQRVSAHVPLQNIIGNPGVPALLQISSAFATACPLKALVQQQGAFQQAPPAAVPPQQPVVPAAQQLVQQVNMMHLQQPSSLSGDESSFFVSGEQMDVAGAPPPGSVFRGHGVGHGTHALSHSIGTGDLIEAIQVLTATISSLALTITASLDAAIERFAQSIEALSKLSE